MMLRSPRSPFRTSRSPWLTLSGQRWVTSHEPRRGEVPLHLIVDNYGTHKHAKVQAWLQRHPRFVLHFVPTSSSWLNLVERWFGVLDDKAIRRGVFRSVEDLEAAIEAFLTAWNKDPKPFVWTATVESITEKLTRCRRTLESIQPGCTSPRTRKKKK
jgi:transposase